jgi:hypothetical protein
LDIAVTSGCLSGRCCDNHLNVLGLVRLRMDNTGWCLATASAPAQQFNASA